MIQHCKKEDKKKEKKTTGRFKIFSRVNNKNKNILILENKKIIE